MPAPQFVIDLAATRLPDEKERLQRQITSTDHQIDTLVYQLYALTDEEIKIVEGSKCLCKVVWSYVYFLLVFWDTLHKV